MSQLILRPKHGNPKQPWENIPAGYEVVSVNNDYVILQDEYLIPNDCWYPNTTNRRKFVGSINAGVLAQDAALLAAAQAADAAVLATPKAYPAVLEVGTLDFNNVSVAKMIFVTPFIVNPRIFLLFQTPLNPAVDNYKLRVTPTHVEVVFSLPQTRTIEVVAVGR